MGELRFGGRLALTFASGYTPAAGTRIDLFDFTRFQGWLGAEQVDVSGFDRARLDFSRLAVDGSVTVLAVPEAGTGWLWLAGLGVLGARLRCARPSHCGTD